MSSANKLLVYLRAWLPGRTTVDARERLRAMGGAALGLLITALICRWIAQTLGGNAVWLIAPLGASAVLVFAVPASPLAQPGRWWAATRCRPSWASPASTGFPTRPWPPRSRWAAPSA